MDYFSIILPKLASFCILIFLGILLIKTHIATQENLSLLSGLVVKLILPCLIFSLIWENHTTFASLLSCHRLVLCQLATYPLLLLLSLLSVKIFHLKPPTSNVNHGCMLGGNTGFFGTPLMMALFAENGGQQYIPICIAVDVLFMWSIGIYIFTTVPGRENDGNGTHSALSRFLKIVLNPVFASFVVGLVVCSLNIPLPDPLISVVDQLGDASCLGLVYLGCSLCLVDFRHFQNVRPLFLLVLFRQILLPLALYLVGRTFLTETELLCIVVVTASPSLSTACAIARENHLDEDYASAAVFVTTIACGVTLPLIFALMAVL